MYSVPGYAYFMPYCRSNAITYALLQRMLKQDHVAKNLLVPAMPAAVQEVRTVHVHVTC